MEENTNVFTKLFTKMGEKLKSLDEKHQKIFEIIFGSFCGLLIWATLLISSNVTDGLLKWGFLIIFIIVMFLRNRIGKYTGWPMTKTTIALAVSLAVCIAISAIYWLITGKLFS